MPPPDLVGSRPNCLDKGLPVRTWRLRGLCAKIRGPYQDKSDRVVLRLFLVQANREEARAGGDPAAQASHRPAADRDRGDLGAVRHPELKFKIQALLFCMSWCADFEFWVAFCMSWRVDLELWVNA